MAYVYAVIVDGVIRYIGKGSGGRLHYHMKMVRKIARRRAAGETVVTTHFYNRLTKAWLDGCQIEFSKLADGLSEVDAFEREAKEIANAPSGLLCNQAPGGEGYSSDQWTNPKFRERMKARDKARTSSEQWRDDHSTTLTLLWQHPEFRELRAKKRWSPEQRKAASELNKKKWAALDPETRAKRNKQNRETAQAAWADPKYREKQSKARSTSAAFAEARRKRSQEMWDNPDSRRAILEAQALGRLKRQSPQE